MSRKRKKSGCLTWLIMILCVMIFGIAVGVVLLLRDDEVRQQVRQTFDAEEIPYQEVGDVEAETGRKYYYEQLKEEEQQVYLELLQGVQEEQGEIYVHASDAVRTNEIFQYVLKDYPEIFWCDGTTTSTSYEGKENYTILQPVYLYTGETRAQKQTEIEAAAEEILADISPETEDYEKILYVYETLVNTVDYDLEATDSQNIYSVFVNRRSVCAGYAKATQYLLEKLDVCCTYVTGMAKEQYHAWNLVMCGGDYYYVDTTWGDPVFQGQEEAQAWYGQNYVNYDYLCCNDAELLKTHIPDGDMPLPACEKMDYNYYVRNGMYYEFYDSQEALQAMNDVIASGSNPVVFKYASAGSYAEAKEDIFGNIIEKAARNLADWYGLSQVNYSYMDDEDLNKITIYWEYGD